MLKTSTANKPTPFPSCTTMGIALEIEKAVARADGRGAICEPISIPQKTDQTILVPHEKIGMWGTREMLGDQEIWAWERGDDDFFKEMASSLNCHNLFHQNSPI